jgi:hypothetical protein
MRNVLALLLWATSALGQNAQLSGLIRDPSDLAISGAEINVRNGQTGGRRTVRSNDSGLYCIPSLKPGLYRIWVQATGFETTIREDVELEVAQNARLDFHLRIGSPHVVATVESLPLINGEDVALGVQLANASLGGVENSLTTRELPLNGRDWTQLATLEPGAIPVRAQLPVGSARGNRGFGTQVSILGNRPFQNSYRMDGIIQNDYANSTPSSVLGLTFGVDAIEEFSVLTSGYNATYGLVSGGVINAITRSGTNNFHGDIYEFLRNDALDARNFFDEAVTPPFRRNQFGASAGGPIAKNRTFIFADYEGLRQSTSTTEIDTVPSAAARAGQLASGQVVVSPAVTPFLPLWPLPNSGLLGKSDTGLYTFVSRSTMTEDFGTIRLDHNILHSDTISGTYMLDSSSRTSPDTLNVIRVSDKTRRQTGSVEEVHIFSSQWLNTFRLGINRVEADVLSTSPGANPLGTATSLGAWPGKAAPQISVPGIATFTGGLGGQAFSLYYFTTYQLYNDVAIQNGIHSLKFGFSTMRFDDNLLITGRPTGEFDFNSLSDFLTNNPSIFFSDIPGPSAAGMRGLRQSVFGAYTQDDIRLRSNLTVNLGLRFEPTSVPAEAHDRIATLHSPFSQNITVGQPYFSNPTLHNFAPRIGIAWDPFSEGTTAVRASFGIYDVLPLVYQYNLLQGYAAPFFLFATINNPPSGSFPTGAPQILTSNPLRLRTSAIQSNPPRDYVMQWNFSIQRSVTPNLTATIAYAGSRGVHMIFIANDANFVLPTLTPQGYLFPINGTVSNPKFGEIRSQFWSGNSSDNALLVKVQKKMSRGVQITGSFTWAKSIDISSSDISAGSYANTVNSLYIDPKLNRGLSDFNIGRDLVISGLWNIPGPASKFAGALKGWEFTAIFAASDGIPFTPLIAGDPLDLKNDVPYDVPDRVISPFCSGLINPGNPNHYINTDCYSFPQPKNLLGNSGRNSLIGPGLVNLDLSLIKNIQLRAIPGAMNLQFRAEVFNVANRANFGLPANQLFNADGSPVASAGLITSTITTSRQLQLGLKLLW